MSRCQTFRHLILEGEPHELRGEGDSPLAAHVRTCAPCASAASRVLDETARLDGFLSGDPSEAQIDAILDRAGWTPSPGSSRTAGGSPWAARALRGSRPWGFFAAAAAVGALLLLPGRPEPPAPELPGVSGSPPPTLEAMSGQRVAVIETDNPEITVLWFF